MNKLPSISTVILAGGQGARLNGQDKGLVKLQGKPLIQHCTELATEFSDQLIISCNRNLEQYAKFGEHIIADGNVDFNGPLAGLFAAAKLCKSEFVLSLPCDMPYLSRHCVEFLIDGLASSQHEVVVAHDGQRRQNLVMLTRKHCLSSIGEYLNSGKRRVDTWQNQWQVLEVDCSAYQSGFHNLNSQKDFQQAEKNPG